MHRRRALPILCTSCSQIRLVATATKQKPISWYESDAVPDLRKWALPPKPAPVSEHTAAAPSTNKWAIPRTQNHPPESTSFSTRADSLNFADRDRSLPAQSSSSTAPTRHSFGPGRLGQKLLRDPPTSGLNKWAIQQPPLGTLYPPPGEQRLKRDPVHHRDRDQYPSRRDPWQRMGSSRKDSWETSALRRTLNKSLRSPQEEPVEKVDTAIPLIERKLKAVDIEPPGDFDVADSWAANTRDSRTRRSTFKERGSLKSRYGDVAIPSYPGPSTQKLKLDTTKPRKKKTLSEKVATPPVYIPSTVSVGTLARLLNVRLERLQQKMIRAGMETEASYDHVLTSDYAVLLAEEFGRNTVVNDEAAFDIYPSPPHPDPSTLPSRPPIVTIMGHVDHGKTTLLDNLRSSSVAKGEAGGITQHIGAFSVPVPAAAASSSGPQSITFLDTPGHAAFSAMRARGAGVTDIIVLVVAADDGIMPQTREVIELTKKDDGKIGVVVAINKVDKPGVDVDNVQKALLSENVQLEVFGGDVPSVPVSGLMGQGLDDLVETLSAMAEVQDLRAERTGLVHGYVLESKVHKGLGPVATVLILRGCMKPGSHIISGTSHAKVRLMKDSAGLSVKAAHPGTAVTVSGWKTLPSAGDEVLEGSEADVKKAVVNRLRKADAESTLVDVQAINTQRRLERERKEESGEATRQTPVEAVQEPKALRLVIKGDVSGSVEAVEGALQGIGNKHAFVKVVSTGVGDVSESDLMMAKAAEAMIVAFSVATPRSVEVMAAQSNVPIYSSNIIYRTMDHIKERVVALLPTIIEKRVTGEATVLQLFEIQLKARQTMTVAGCRVVNGILERAKNFRVVRDGSTVFDGTLDTMRYMKKDIDEVRKGSECGLRLHKFDDLREGDLIQAYQIIETPGVL